jgi:NHL repeat
MPEALKCPACSAPLQLPPGGGPTAQCPYCHCTILVPGISQSATPADGDAVRPLIGKTLEMAQIARLARSGKTIDAIKLYRQLCGSDLPTAKTAIDNLAAGRAAMLGSAPAAFSVAPDSARIVSFSSKLALGLTIGIILFVVILIKTIAHSVRSQVQSAQQTFAPLIQNATVSPAPPPPPAPAFAHMTREFGSEGIGPGQFTDCRSIALDGNGHIYVGEYSDGRVQVFDSTGKFLRTWSIGQGKSLLNLTATRSGTVFAVVPAHIYAYEGITGRAFGEAQHADDDGNSIFYTDAFASLSGDIYTLAGDSDIVILDSEGKLKSIIHAGEKVGESLNLDRIVVSGAGEIYALDRSKGVFQFAPDGRYINRFGAQGSDPAQIRSAFNLAVDGKGRVFVSGADPAIEVFSADGQYLDSFGGEEVVFGLAVTDQNEILACFRNRHAVRKFALEKP